MNRLTKQIIYGLFYLVILFGIFSALYFSLIKPAPTCTDVIQNRDEEAVDCGGQYCVSCEIKNLSPIKAQPVRLLPGSTDTATIALVELRNPNPRYGLTSFSYTLDVFASSSTEPTYREKIDLPMYPSEIKYRVSINIPVPFGSIQRAVVTPQAPRGFWRSSSEFSKPELPVREIKTIITNGRATTSGIIRNESVTGLSHVTVTVLFEDGAGNLSSASRTLINDLPASEERGFQVVALIPEALRDKELPAPRIIVDGEL